MPVYNESPERVLSALEAMARSLISHGAGRAFDIFILSDTPRKPHCASSRKSEPRHCKPRLAGRIGIYYRRRAENKHKKAGNIADFVTRWGGAYESMVVLDADSHMDGKTLDHPGARHGRRSQARHRPDPAAAPQSLDALCAHAAIRRTGLWAARRRGSCRLAWRGRQLLGPQRDHPGQGLCRMRRPARAQGPQAVRRPYSEPRFRRGGTDPARRLEGRDVSAAWRLL